MKRTWKGYLLVGPLLAGFLLFYVFPFGQVVWDSLSQGTGKSQLFVGLENYTRMFQNQMFLAAFGNTLRFLGIGLPVLLLLAYALALFLKGWAQRFQVLRAVFLLPYVMPVAGTVLLIDLLFSETGLVNRVLLALGLPLADWLQSPAAFWVMLLFVPVEKHRLRGGAAALRFADYPPGALPGGPGGGGVPPANLPVCDRPSDVVRFVSGLCILPDQRLQVLPGDLPGGGRASP